MTDAEKIAEFFKKNKSFRQIPQQAPVQQGLKPYAHQQRGFDRFKDDPAFALFMDPGTGKTKLVLDILLYKYRNKEVNQALILTPKSICGQWIKDEIPLHFVEPHTILDIVQSKKSKFVEVYKRTKDKPFVFFVVNIEALQLDTKMTLLTHFMKRRPTMLIVDESSTIKSPRAKRTINTLKLARASFSRAILTGTPVTRHPFGLFSQFNCLRPSYFGDNSFTRFQKQHAIIVKDHGTGGKMFTRTMDKHLHRRVWGQLRLKENPIDVAERFGIDPRQIHWIGPDYEPYFGLDRLKSQIEPITYFVKKADCLDLPSKIYTKLEVEPTKEFMTLYKSFKNKLYLEFKGVTLSVPNKAVLVTRLRQFAGGFFPEDGGSILRKNLKLDALQIELEELDEPIIIWASFVNELEMLAKRIRGSKLLYGKTSNKDEIIRDFRSGQFKVLISNPSVGGYGLNLQHCSTQYFFSNSFNVQHRLQAEDRSHRIGVKSTCVYRDIVLTETIDETILVALQSGRSLNEYYTSATLEDILWGD